MANRWPAMANRAPWLLALGLLAAPSLGCKKQTDSLVVVGLTGTPADDALPAVVITVSSAARSSNQVSQTFNLRGGLGALTVSYGVYLPASISGPIDVLAVADDGTGNCTGYVGSASTSLDAGATVTVTIGLVAGNTCVGGTGGPTQISTCTEVDHRADPTADCTVGSDDDTTDTEITDLAFTPDGKLLFSAGTDGRVKVWSWNGSVLSAANQELDVNPGGLVTLAVSADNKLVAAGSLMGQVNVWNIGGQWSVAANLVTSSNDTSGVAFGPDQTLYVIDDAKTLYIYTSASTLPQSTMTLPDYAFTVSTSPTEGDGSYWLALGYEHGNATLTNVKNAVLGSQSSFTVSATDGSIYSLLFAPNGQLLESGADDGSFGIWSVPLPASGAPNSPSIELATDFVWAAAFDPSSAYVGIAVGYTQSESQLGIWNAATGAQKSVVAASALSYQPRSVTFSPDGHAIVSGEFDCGQIVVCTGY